MKLGKILGTIGGGMLGGGLLGMLGGGGLGQLFGGQGQGMGMDEEGMGGPNVKPMPQPNMPGNPMGGMTEGVMGFDPISRGQNPMVPQGQMPRQFGRVGNDIYMGGRHPFGQNFLGRLFQ